MSKPTYSVVAVARPADWHPKSLTDAPALIEHSFDLDRGLTYEKAEETVRQYNQVWRDEFPTIWAVIKAEATRKAPQRDLKPATIRVKPEARQPLYAIILRHPGGLVELAHTGFSKPTADAYASRMKKSCPELRVERREMSWSVEVFPGRVVTGGPNPPARR